MLTYVINTSENKTFDSDRLFDLAGYHKIHWMNCSLSGIGECARTIHEKQNILGADRFRIAVLVDFFGFDRLRIPYGRRGFSKDDGVDVSLYIPYIEVFLLDNLIAYLEKREMYTEDFEVYYVQNTRLEPYEFLDNAPEQLCSILHGVSDETLEKSTVAFREDMDMGTPAGERNYPATVPKCERYTYRAFDLHCTERVSLRFYLTDYPYGATAMTFWEFYLAFRRRLGNKRGIRRHYYISTYGGGNARAAFDTLSLSLYLIRMYEREEEISNEGEMEVLHLDADTLREVLETAWGKVNLARTVAKENDSKYFSLKQNMGIRTTEQTYSASTEEIEAYEEMPEMPRKIEDVYERICYFYYRTPQQVAEDHREEFNRIMSAYLIRRDDTREIAVEAEFDEMVRNESITMTAQCPSKEEYLYLVDTKQKEISEIFERALDADYLGVKFDAEKKRADKAFRRYERAKACLHRNIIGDIIFMILALLSVFVPYAVLQLSKHSMGFPENIWFALNMLAPIGALFVLAVILCMLPLIWELRNAKHELRSAYADCIDKERLSMSKIRERYETDLIRIEHIRYELRQLKRLYEANLKKDANVQRHRDMLEEVEDRLSAILNNLDVEPTVDPDESVEGEFDLTKPIRAVENKIYRIFSIETIERMFPKKGRDTQ